MEEPAAHNGSAAGAAPGAGTPARPPATPEGMALAYGSLVLMALLPIFFGALRSVSCAKSKVPPRLGAAGPIGLAPPQESPPGDPFHGRTGSCMSPVPGLEADGTPGKRSGFPRGLSSHILTSPINSSAAKHNSPLSLLKRSCVRGLVCGSAPRHWGRSGGALLPVHPVLSWYSSRYFLHFIEGI